MNYPSKNVTIHGHRKSTAKFASWLAMAGTQQRGLMSLLGHRDPKMTLRYAHISDQHRRTAVASLPSFADAVDAQKKSPEIPYEGANQNVLSFVSH
jgi:integrase